MVLPGTSWSTVGLYLAYIIPVYLRLRAGDSFQPGPWTLGRHYKWVNAGAILFVLLVVYSLDIPFSSSGVPWNSGWKWSSLNYSPLVLLVGLAVGIWWVVLAAAFADDEACSSFVCLTFSDTLVLLAVPGAIVWSLGLIVLYIARRLRRRSASDGKTIAVSK